ncbi:hypothetical protein Tco_0039416 [Tanacetum coccineum]
MNHIYTHSVRSSGSSSGSSGDVNSGHDARDAVMRGGWTHDLVGSGGFIVVVGRRSPSNMVVDGDLESVGVGDAFVRGGGGFIVAVGGGSPPNMVVDGDFGSGGVGNVVVVGGDRGVLVIGSGGRPHDMVGDMVDRGRSVSHMDDASPA